ncbi:Fungal specific transcription factor domain [Teratosphaeria destructans]|uniref:Fungal specific transcription factor domain n=1 Tax=Teratosphaeria destructans TaxID=418781 RepID=A0A9W7VYP2_9PEZI|nr:Fungal specific transcription factor domain [Teratosphaeria destructans]
MDTHQLASSACASCRKQKRKCDKQLPTCGLCQRIGRICDYSDDARASAPSPEEFSQLRQEVAELKNLLQDVRSSGLNAPAGFGSSAGSISNEVSPASHQSAWPGLKSFPALYFLDSNAFEYERFQIQAPYIRVPPGALSALGNSTELRLMIEQYFSSVHTYLPIVSKIRLYQHLSNPLHEPGADMALLFLAMKLASSEIPEGLAPLTQLYQDVKSFASYVEASNGLNIQLIQALLLICLYETGHGIYPAAYLSVGHAGRLGHAMGLHDRSAPQMLQRCTTWTEQEERRRVWWAVVVMDRFVSIGNRGKPFATSDPSLDAHLPTEDAAWDRGQMLVAAPLALSASTTNQAAPFARTCQASHLLGKVIRHRNDTNMAVDYKFEEALQLNRTLRALAAVLPGESEEDDPTQRPTLCTSMAITYSALLELYEAYSCTERAVPNGPETQLQMQQEAIAGISDITTQVLYLARRVRNFISRAGIGRFSPFTLDALYQGAANFAWYVRESSDPACGERLLEIKEVLLLCEKRWKVAGQYICFPLRTFNQISEVLMG